MSANTSQEIAEADVGNEDAAEVLSPPTDPAWGSMQAARTWPRSIKAFAAGAEAMATLTQEIAAECFYVVPRDGKQIVGPSVRLAEICASAWGNIDFGSRIGREEQTCVIAQGFAYDLQTNTRCTFEVRRRIVTRDGRRYGEDMITTTVNAAQSIALRNAIFRVIPRALVMPVFEAARRVAAGDAKTHTARRTAMVAHFGKLGVNPSRIAAAVGKESVEEIVGDDLSTLRGLANAIRDGLTTVEAAFPVEPGKPKMAAPAYPASRPNRGINSSSCSSRTSWPNRPTCFFDTGSRNGTVYPAGATRRQG
jgi:hypothetical protein